MKKIIIVKNVYPKNTGNGKIIMQNNKIIAQETERYVQQTLNSLGLNCISINDGSISPFDLIANKIPIEVKSCHIVRKNGKKHKNTLGYFEFRKNPYNALLESDAYYCFVIMYNNERLIAGFIKANKFGKFQRYIQLRKILNKKLLTKEEFVEAIK